MNRLVFAHCLCLYLLLFSFCGLPACKTRNNNNGRTTSLLVDEGSQQFRIRKVKDQAVLFANSSLNDGQSNSVPLVSMPWESFKIELSGEFAKSVQQNDASAKKIENLKRETEITFAKDAVEKLEKQLKEKGFKDYASLGKIASVLLKDLIKNSPERKFNAELQKARLHLADLEKEQKQFEESESDLSTATGRALQSFYDVFLLQLEDQSTTWDILNISGSFTARKRILNADVEAQFYAESGAFGPLNTDAEIVRRVILDTLEASFRILWNQKILQDEIRADERRALAQSEEQKRLALLEEEARIQRELQQSILEMKKEEQRLEMQRVERERELYAQKRRDLLERLKLDYPEKLYQNILLSCKIYAGLKSKEIKDFRVYRNVARYGHEIERQSICERFVDELHEKELYNLKLGTVIATTPDLPGSRLDPFLPVCFLGIDELLKELEFSELKCPKAAREGWSMARYFFEENKDFFKNILEKSYFKND